MLKKNVVEYFGGYPKVAAICGISRQAVHVWTDVLKKGTEDRLLAGMILKAYNDGDDLKTTIKEFLELKNKEV